jgi:hypothetical protein
MTAEDKIMRGWTGSVRLNSDLQYFIRRNMLEDESPNQALKRILKVEQWKRRQCPEDWNWSGRVTCTQRAYQVDVSVAGTSWSVPFLGEAS